LLAVFRDEAGSKEQRGLFDAIDLPEPAVKTL